MSSSKKSFFIIIISGIQIFLNYVPVGRNVNKSALVPEVT